MVDRRVLYTNPKNSWIRFLEQKGWRWDGKSNAALNRQIETARLLLKASQEGKPGAILADDVGLGKTWVGIILAIAFASAGGRVVIAAPNRNIREKWGLEFDKWYGDENNRRLQHLSLKKDKLGKLHPGEKIFWGKKGIEAEYLKNGRILLVRHDQFWERTTWSCDLLIMDEAHRRRKKMKEDFLKVANASFKLFLTATPYGKDPLYFKTLLNAIGYSETEELKNYLTGMKQRDPDTSSEKAAKAAYRRIKSWLIRHTDTVENIGKREKNMLGEQVHILGSFMKPEEQEEQHPIPLPESEEGNRIRKIILCMERLKKIDEGNVLGIRAQQVLTAPYSTRAVERILKKKPKSHEDFSPEMTFYISELRSLVRGHYGPMEQALFYFSCNCFGMGDKFIVFCHHHDTAKTVEGILRKARKRSKLESSFDPENDKNFEKAWEKIEKRKKDHPRHFADSILRNNKDKIRKSLLLSERVNASGADYKKTIDDLLRYRRVLSKLDQDKGQEAGAVRIGYVERLKGDARSNIARILFNTPFNPQALVITGKDSEGIDLHENCRILVHYELTYRPETVIQANGRIRRIGCLGAKSKKPILYYYPYLEGTRSEKLTKVVLNRVERFRKLMGGLPELNLEQLDDLDETENGKNISKMNDYSNKVYKRTLGA